MHPLLAPYAHLARPRDRLRAARRAFRQRPRGQTVGQVLAGIGIDVWLRG